MEVTGANQNFLIYKPREHRADAPRELTPALWQGQMQKLVRVLSTAPAPSHAPAVARVEGRDGKVLGPDNFLKADHFPGLHHDRLQETGQPKIEGAPNYRELGENIHGTGQPSLQGMRDVLKQAGAGPDGDKTAVWTNLREEPVVYINGQSFNLRHVKAPFYNQASPGRSAQEVDALEKQLKQDILDEAAKNGGFITLHGEEGNPPKVVERKVKIESVQTVGEAYEQLQSEGYKVKYQRVPVTDMKKPEDGDIDELVKALKDVDPDAPLIFNCHAGQGRTTTAMVLASLMRKAKNGEEGKLLKDETLREDIKEQGKHNPSFYRTILNTIKDVQTVVRGEKDVDDVVKKYSDVADLKGAVGKARRQAIEAKTPEERRAANQRAKDYLDRYHTLVSFEAYTRDQAPDFNQSYSQWKEAHPRIDRTLEGLRAAQ
ncbi:MAG: hypothetical protein KC910_21875 [Candidatus Eremiobacteraeota bacterium]|nr:hypothetical protein [Candidatus Eremiobacteraeota bacterium]